MARFLIVFLYDLLRMFFGWFWAVLDDVWMICFCSIYLTWDIML